MADRLFHSRSERRGCFTLLLLLLLLVAAFLIVKECKPRDEKATLTAAQQQEFSDFEAQLKTDSIAWVRSHHSNKWEREHREVETFPFDPNTADSLTLLRLGFHPWQAKAMRKYRERGGRWKSAEDFRRLYGLTETNYQRLKPYIRIVPTDYELRRIAHQAHYDSVKAQRNYPQKLPKGATVDMNTADTTLLKQIPGIGSYYAQKICRYREALGGFVALEQINEISDLPADIHDWLTFSPQPIKRILLNKATFKELVRHPYLNYEQVKEIVNLRQQNGALRSWQDLRLSKHFTAADFERLAPYFQF